MFDSTSHTQLRRKLLAACVITACALANDAFAIAVSDCTDGGGTGTLRGLVTSGLYSTITIPTTCSTITLTSGAIPVAQNNLTITGPATRMTINTNTKDRLFTHTGTGNFTLSYLNLTNGHAYDNTTPAPGIDEKGGCISSNGNVFINDSSVYSCVAESKQGHAFGGGIYAAKLAWATRSTITNNRSSSIRYSANGGGIYSKLGFVASYSTISGNVACDNVGCSGDGGGVATSGSASIQHSTISGNYARNNGGGVKIKSFSVPPPTSTISGSTISGNHAISGSTGGFYTNASLTVSNSTIAFNVAASNASAAGLAIKAAYSDITATLNSVLLSNNAVGATEIDFSTSATGHSVTVSGADNLIAKYSGSVPATGLITSACALLGPLRDNGGATKTHQLLSHSPAIDFGNDTSTATGTHYDQRGTGFPRTSAFAPDIGAYEVQAEVVFNAGFDGCP